MNAQDSQNLHNCMQSEVSYLCKSSTEKSLGLVNKLIKGIRRYYENRTLTSFLSKMHPKLLRDIGLDDPQVQMHRFESNFNTEASIMEMERNKQLFR